MSFDERALFLPSSTWLDRASMELSINSATATWGHLGVRLYRFAAQTHLA